MKTYPLRKSTLADLLEKEKAYGIDESIKAEKTDLGDFDVAVIGGGPAGASAAIYTSRKGLKTIIITDRVGGQMQDTKGIENFISIPCYRRSRIISCPESMLSNMNTNA